MKTSSTSESSRFGINAGKIAWLKKEISMQHRIVRSIETELYHTHLYIISVLCKNNLLVQMYWTNFTNDLEKRLSNMCKTIRERHARKYKRLLEKQKIRRKPAPEIIPDFVVNLSSQNLSALEMNLLNKGLKYVITPSQAHYSPL